MTIYTSSSLTVCTLPCALSPTLFSVLARDYSGGLLAGTMSYYTTILLAVYIVATTTRTSIIPVSCESAIFPHASMYLRILLCAPDVTSAFRAADAPIYFLMLATRGSSLFSYLFYAYVYTVVTSLGCATRTSTILRSSFSLVSRGAFVRQMAYYADMLWSLPRAFFVVVYYNSRYTWYLVLFCTS